MIRRISATLLVSAIGVLSLAPAASARSASPLEPLRSWAQGASPSQRSRAALRELIPDAARDLRRLDDGARAAELRRTGRVLDRRFFAATGLQRLRGLRALLFHVSYQRQLERLARRAGLLRAPTGRLLHAPGRDLSIGLPDADGDGIIDQADDDDDDDGTPDAKDGTDLGWGISDTYAVRRVSPVPRTWLQTVLGSAPTDSYRVGTCIWITEEVPDVRSLADARRLRERAADRGCAAPAAASRKRARRAPIVSLAKVGVKVKAPVLDGRGVRLKVRSKKAPARIALSAVGSRTAKAILARAKAFRVKKGAKLVERSARLDRAPVSKKLFLRVDARVGKRLGRGLIGLKIAPGPNPTCNPAADRDTDGDGLSDCTELAGFDWKFFLPASECPGFTGAFACVTSRTEHVTSDPNAANTDGDTVSVGGVDYALTDGEEWADFRNGGLANPRAVDSDGDGLGDVEEVRRWGTNPSAVDSDADSARAGSGQPPKSQLYDGAEINGGALNASVPPTNALAGDTDGDGTSDLDEINAGVSSPIVADVPTLRFTPPPNSTFTIGLGQDNSTSVVLATSSETENARGTEDTQSEETVNGRTREVNLQLSAEFEASADPSLTIGVEAQFNNQWSNTQTQSSQFTVNQSSRDTAQQSYENQVQSNTDSAGSLTTSLHVENLTKFSGLRIENLEVTASFICLPPARDAQTTCGAPGKLAPFPVPLTPASPVQIPANGDADVTVSATNIPAPLLRALIASPSNISFKVTKATLFLDGAEKSLNDTVGQSIPQSTAGLTIDDGEGGVDHYSVAVNLGREWGRPAAVQAPSTPLRDVLRAVGIEPDVDTRADGLDRIRELNGKRSLDTAPNGAIPGAWLIFGKAVKLGETRKFDELALNVFDQVNIAYLRDQDADGLFDRQERDLGTNDLLADSDGDGLGDFAETQEGFDVGPVNGTPVYHVYPDPRKADQDNDNLSDAAERVAKTDPRRRDTDGDDLQDDVDNDPLFGKVPVVTADFGPRTGLSVTGGPACTADACTVIAGQSVRTNAVTLCGPNSGEPTCAGRTGFYRAALDLTTTGVEFDTAPVAWLRVLSGDDVLFESSLDPREADTTAKDIWFAPLAPKDDVRIVVSMRSNTPATTTVKRIRFEPVTRTAYLNAFYVDQNPANGTDPRFAGVEYNHALLGMPDPSLDNPSANPAQKTFGPDNAGLNADVTLPSDLRSGWAARFGLSTTTTTALPSYGAILGVHSGGPAGTAESLDTSPANTGSPQYDSIPNFSASAGRSPVGQGWMFREDFETVGRLTYLPVLFETHGPQTNLDLTVVSAPGLAGVSMNGIVVEPIGKRIDLERQLGHYNGGNPGSPAAPQRVNTAGFSLLPESAGEGGSGQPFFVRRTTGSGATTAADSGDRSHILTGGPSGGGAALSSMLSVNGEAANDQAVVTNQTSAARGRWLATASTEPENTCGNLGHSVFLRSQNLDNSTQSLASVPQFTQVPTVLRGPYVTGNYSAFEMLVNPCLSGPGPKIRFRRASYVRRPTTKYPAAGLP